MHGILRQAQGVQLFPGSNAGLGRIQVRALFRELEPPAQRPFTFFERTTFGVGSDELGPGVRRGPFRIGHVGGSSSLLLS